MSIRQLVNNTTRSVTRQTWSRSVNYTSIRSIYIRTPPKTEPVEDKQSALTEQQKTIARVKEFLGEKYAIPDELALQVMTHKSFDGLKPHHEKLQILGSHLMKLYFAKHAIQRPHKNDELAINGMNLDILSTPYHTALTNPRSLGYFAKHEKLNEGLRWKCSSTQLGFESSGEMRVSAMIVNSIVGAIDFVYGKQIAEEFIHEKMARSLEKSGCYVQKQYETFD
ncbi:uncharacterized protein J8A68_005806 [[Candida] subhashii]|uniref:RNase III domain-containing protein n=1 Tax=[Candida] subhashii TaxID=561895 RepID=A0A8J5Q1X4_9ASCO|nr:uncharacterized protein J8A68_005806 [[Candida] subhashii]KAG7660689.1 hypothetical protein J8A68_005806 [[Candida] subhashii]